MPMLIYTGLFDYRQIINGIVAQKKNIQKQISTQDILIQIFSLNAIVRCMKEDFSRQQNQIHE